MGFFSIYEMDSGRLLAHCFSKPHFSYELFWPVDMLGEESCWFGLSWGGWRLGGRHVVRRSPACPSHELFLEAKGEEKEDEGLRVRGCRSLPALPW